eukprot:Skav207607  [mRNA]  locus=scaffold1878:21008:23830:+ [translate_table: standard]
MCLHSAPSDIELMSSRWSEVLHRYTKLWQEATPTWQRCCWHKGLELMPQIRRVRTQVVDKFGKVFNFCSMRQHCFASDLSLRIEWWIEWRRFTKPLGHLFSRADKNPGDLRCSFVFRGATPLHKAVAKGHASVALLLIAQGAAVDVRDKKGQSPRGRRKECLSGRTPLHWAAYNGYSSMAELLLAKCAAVNTATFGGRTPLHKAAFRGHSTVAEILLAKGASIDATDGIGLTPQRMAEDNGHSMVVLVTPRGEGAPARSNGLALRRTQRKQLRRSAPSDEGRCCGRYRWRGPGPQS